MTSTLPAQSWKNPKKFRNHHLKKNRRFLLPRYRPTGHCPNASMVSQPLGDKKEARAEGGRRFQREGPATEKDLDLATVVLEIVVWFCSTIFDN